MLIRARMGAKAANRGLSLACERRRAGEHGTVQQILHAPQTPLYEDLISSVPLLEGIVSSIQCARAGPKTQLDRALVALLRMCARTYGSVHGASSDVVPRCKATRRQIHFYRGPIRVRQIGRWGSIIAAVNPPSEGKVLLKAKTSRPLNAAQSSSFRKNVQPCSKDPYLPVSTRLRVNHTLKFH